MTKSKGGHTKSYWRIKQIHMKHSQHSCTQMYIIFYVTHRVLCSCLFVILFLSIFLLFILCSFMNTFLILCLKIYFYLMVKYVYTLDKFDFLLFLFLLRSLNFLVCNNKMWWIPKPTKQHQRIHVFYNQKSFFNNWTRDLR